MEFRFEKSKNYFENHKTKLFPLPSLIRLGDEYTKNNCRGRLESNRKKGKVKTKWS